VTSLGYDVTGLPADTSGTPGSAALGPRGPPASGNQQRPPFHGLERFVSRSQIDQWMNEWRQMLLRGETDAYIDDWVARLFDRYGHRVVGRRPCTQRRGLYRADARATPYNGRVTAPCHACSK